MGLQVTAANKRKHDITFEGKDVNTYTTSPPPIKTCKWSVNNNNYIDAVEEEMGKIPIVEEKEKEQEHEQDKQHNNDVIHNKDDDKATAAQIVNNNNNENSACGKECQIVKEDSKATTQTSSQKPCKRMNCFTTLISITTATSTVSETITTTTTRTSTSTVSLLQLKPEISATTPLPPTPSTPVPEDSIAKLEVVAAAPLAEPWSTTAVAVEPVDCISKLQAVAVPSDPWGSIGTRSTLATTLLSTDELDDDDDDFEDDYEEDEGLIPTYCSLRYHPLSATGNNTVTRSNSSYVPSSSYGISRPNYYSEPFPQQNCARTNNSPHMRLLGSNCSSFQWSNMNQYYMMPEAAYTAQAQEQQPPQQQQTIRCAENGKSYLELGCSSSLTASATTPPATQVFNHQTGMHTPPSCGFVSMSTSHALKRCCDTRSGVWCAATTTANKNCYKDIRLKIRNLSMFKLSRFRQVSEQSLYRSVLICNTLKRIDREIEAEAKEMHQAAAAAAAAHAHAAAAAAQHHAPAYNHLNGPPNSHHQMPSHLSSTPNHHMQQQHHLQQHMHQQQQQHQQDYAPVMSCARLTNIEYQVPLQHHQQQHIQQQQQQQHYQQQHYLGLSMTGSDLLETIPSAGGGYFNSSMQQKSSPFILNNNNNNSNNNNTNNNSHTNSSGNSTSNNNNSNNCDTTTTTTNSGVGMHPYDHYPFRETHSGRATPYPCQFPTATTPPPAPSLIAPPVILSVTQTSSTASSSTITSVASCALANTKTTTATTTNSSNNNIVVINSLETVSNNIDTNSSSITATVDFVEDVDATRSSSINWSSVLSLSSQSALDPLNNNDLFTILPPATNPAVAVPVSVSATSTTAPLSSVAASTISATTTAAVTSTSIPPSSNTTATFTTLSTISSATHSLTSSYVSSMNAASSNSSWEYGFLDMEFGLGTEFTELMPPNCKMTSDDLFKNALTPVSTSRYTSVHENELEQPAHIMVGS